MRVCYSIGSTLAGGGIGNTAYYGAEGLWRNKAVQRVYALDYCEKKIPSALVTTNRALKYLDLPLGFTRARFIPCLPQYDIINNAYDRWAARHLDECDLFHGWMGMSLNQVRTAQMQKPRKHKTIIGIECASSHPTNQRKLLQREYRRWKVPLKLYDKGIHQKSLKELAEADYIKIPSDFVRDSFLKAGFPSEKLIQIPFGVDAKRFTPKKSYSSDTFRAVFIGSAGVRKGIPDLLKAWDFAKLKNAELHIAGAVLKEIKHIVANYAGRKDVIFHGFVDPRPLLQRADLFVFPSIEEGSALVTYEAMASGVPCLVTYNSGSLVRDKKDGFIVPACNPKRFAKMLVHAANNQGTLKKMGLSARRYIQQFTWERHGNDFFKELKRRFE